MRLTPKRGQKENGGVGKGMCDDGQKAKFNLVNVLEKYDFKLQM